MSEDERDFLTWLVRRVERDEWDGAQLRGLRSLLEMAAVGADAEMGNSAAHGCYTAALETIAGTVSAQELMRGEWAG